MFQEDFSENPGGTLKLYGGWYVVSGNWNGGDLTAIARLQNSISQAWIGWGNVGISFTSVGFNIPVLSAGSLEIPLAGGPTFSAQWHEYRIIRTAQEVKVFADGILLATAVNYPEWSSGPVRLGGTVSGSSAFMELDWLRYSE